MDSINDIQKAAVCQHSGPRKKHAGLGNSEPFYPLKM